MIYLTLLTVRLYIGNLHNHTSVILKDAHTCVLFLEVPDLMILL
jgi:hypothetical protein